MRMDRPTSAHKTMGFALGTNTFTATPNKFLKMPIIPLYYK